MGQAIYFTPSIDYIAFDGSTYYESECNFDLEDYGLDAGKIRVTTGASSTAHNTNLGAADVTNLAIVSSTFDLSRVRTANATVGKKVEILNGASAVQATWYFYPQEECKYTSVIIHFVNEYGAWQRELFLRQVTIRLALRTRNIIYCKLRVLTTTSRKNKDKHLT